MFALPLPQSASTTVLELSQGIQTLKSAAKYTLIERFVSNLQCICRNYRLQLVKLENDQTYIACVPAGGGRARLGLMVSAIAFARPIASPVTLATALLRSSDFPPDA